MKNLHNYFSMEVINLSSSGNQALLEELTKFINVKNKHENKKECQGLQIIIDSTSCQLNELSNFNHNLHIRKH